MRDLTTIKLKIWPEFFERVISGHKRAEFRKNDKDFQEGDLIILQEWSPKSGRYTGRKTQVEISDVISGGYFGIPEGYCMFSIRKPTQPRSDKMEGE